MSTSEPITLHYSPQTRATGTRLLLEELGAPYTLHILNMKIDEQRRPPFLAINPLGKVPAIRHGKTLVTEQSAIYIYLSDLYPEAGLTPAIDDPDRGAFLRWIVFYAACFEPAVVDRSMKREPAPLRQSPYGDYDSVLAVIEDALRPGPYLLGERFSTADLLWGMALNWTTMFGLVPSRPVFRDYIERIAARDSFKKVTDADAVMAAEHEAVAQSMTEQVA
ncbi:MAG: glutathione S-transferase family protein [Allorhizobium sp.]